LTKLSNPAPLSVGLPMPAACCTTLTDVINVHPMMAFGASVRYSVRAERITGMRTPVTTKESAAATVQRSTSKVRIDLEKSRSVGGDREAKMNLRVLSHEIQVKSSQVMYRLDLTNLRPKHEL
jgi:hypothetical protein